MEVHCVEMSDKIETCQHDCRHSWYNVSSCQLHHLMSIDHRIWVAGLMISGSQVCSSLGNDVATSGDLLPFHSK